MSSFKILPKIVLAWVLIFLGACSSPGDQAGAEDFPNTLAEMGSSISAARKTASEISPPQAPEDIFQTSADAGLALGEKVLKETAWIPGDSGMIYSDTSKGRLLWFKKYSFENISRSDTIAMVYDAQSQDFLTNPTAMQSLLNRPIFTVNYLSNTSNHKWIQRLEDADGDGIIKGGINKVQLQQTWIKDNFRKEVVLIVASGADQDFDSQDDNLSYGSTQKLWEKSRLVDSVTISPLDGDTIVIHPDSQMNHYQLEVYKELDNCILEQQGQFAFLGKDTDHGWVEKFDQKNTCADTLWHSTVNLQRTKWPLVNKDSIEFSEKLIIQKDTLQINRVELERDFSAKLVQKKTISFAQEKPQGDQEWDYLRLKLTPGEPVAEGVEFFDGQITMEVKNSENTYILEGEMENGEVIGTTRDQNGNEWPVHWGADGQLKDSEN